MLHLTANEWDEAFWLQAEPIYEEAFPAHGRKSRDIIRRMLDKGLCTVHVWREGHNSVAMAITGIDRSKGILILDYMAVRSDLRSRGLGLACLQDIRGWAESETECKGIVIEAEADPSEENEARFRFWEKAGFRRTDYVHTYIWVPEKYRALYLSFYPNDPLPADGNVLFRSIIHFHEKAYRGYKAKG